METGARSSALKLFPEEVWETILESIEDSLDIRNVIDAFPELALPMMKNSQRWFFAQVTLLLRSFLEDDDFLSCRQVSKRWCQGVNLYLGKMPIHKVPWSDPPATDELWFPEASKNYQLLSWDESLATVQFSNEDPEVMEEFIRQMGKSSSFPWRIFKFMEIEYTMNSAQFYFRVLEVIRKFADRIWYLNLTSYEYDERLLFCQFLFAALELLPNLKGLEMYFCEGEEESDVNKFLEIRRDYFPDLPHLRSLKFEGDDIPPSLVHSLMIRYSGQLQRLDMPHRYWRIDYSAILPKLAELKIDEFVGESKEAVHQFYSSMEAPNLAHVHLRICKFENGDPPNGNDLVRWMTAFPRILSFYLNVWGLDPNEQWPEKTIPHPSDLTVSTLRSLIIKGDFEGLDSLGLFRFPSLEYLQMHGMGDGTFSNYFEANIMYRDTQLWGMFPKLKELYVRKFEQNRIAYEEKRYDRSTYERINRQDNPNRSLPPTENEKHRPQSISIDELSKALVYSVYLLSCVAILFQLICGLCGW